MTANQCISVKKETSFTNHKNQMTAERKLFFLWSETTEDQQYLLFQSHSLVIVFLEQSFILLKKSEVAF